jgi:hypothetical protein
MRGWWPWNPKAMRVSNRILVLGLDERVRQPVIERRFDGVAVRGDLAVEVDERGEV